MNTKLNFKALFLEDVKEILLIASNSAPDAAYVNDFTVASSTITAQCEKNEEESKGIRPKFDTVVSSDYFSEATLREKFEAYAWALK